MVLICSKSVRTPGWTFAVWVMMRRLWWNTYLFYHGLQNKSINWESLRHLEKSQTPLFQKMLPHLVLIPLVNNIKHTQLQILLKSGCHVPTVNAYDSHPSALYTVVISPFNQFRIWLKAVLFLFATILVNYPPCLSFTRTWHFSLWNLRRVTPSLQMWDAGGVRGGGMF